MHIVSLNHNRTSEKDFFGAVTGILFRGTGTSKSFADDFFLNLIVEKKRTSL